MTPWIIAHQAPLSMEFSKQEYWCGLPFPSPGDLQKHGIKPRSPRLQADFTKWHSNSTPQHSKGTKFIRLKWTWGVSEGIQMDTLCVCVCVCVCFVLQILNSNFKAIFSWPEVGEQGLLRDCLESAHESEISHPSGNGIQCWELWKVYWA